MHLVKVKRERQRNNLIEMGKYDNYVAIDLSIESMAIAVMKRSNRKMMTAEIATNILELKKYLKSLSGKTIVTFEESTGAHWLYLELKGIVDRVLVCDPYMNKLLSDGPKNDRIDAIKLCDLLRNGSLIEVFHPDDDRLYQLRRLVSAYDDMVKHGVRSQNQRYALIRGLGSKKNKLDDMTAFISGFVERDISFYEETKAAYEDKFESLCKTNRLLKALTSLGGIGPIRAVKILATVIEPKRFPTMGKYFAYCGLVRVEKTSGRKKYGTRKPHYNRML
ncbi:MAG: IS110 family transposase, partial [Candidatus Kryptoniota bacterium]